MKKIMIVFYISSLFILFNSCTNKAKHYVNEMEICLGDNKTEQDLDNLSKSEALEILKCLQITCDDVKEKVENMNPEEQGKFVKQIKDAINQSPNKEVLEQIDCNYISERIEELENDTN